MGTGRFSLFHYNNMFFNERGNLDKAEFSMLKASTTGRFKFFKNEEEYRDYFSERGNKQINNMTYVINHKDSYTIMGDFWAKSPEIAVKEVFQGLRNVSTIKRRDVEQQIMRQLKWGRSGKNKEGAAVNFNIQNVEQTKDKIFIREMNGVKIYILGANKYQVKINIQKPTRTRNKEESVYRTKKKKGGK